MSPSYFYLHECCDEHFLSFIHLINTRQTLTNNEYTVIFRVKPDIALVRAQARLFSAKAVTEIAHGYPLSRTQSARDIDELKQRIENTYVYSYFKVLFYIRNMYQLGHNIDHPNLGESLAFHGHVMLFNTLVKKFHRTVQPSNATTLIRRIDLYLEDFIEELEKDEVWVSGTSGELGQDDFFSSKYEFVLEDLRFNHKDIKIDSLHKKGASYGSVPDSNPLGNACYDLGQNNVLSVVNKDAVGNPLCRAWNLANCIVLEDENVLPNQESVFIDVPVGDLDFEFLKYMVQSITGLNIVTGLSSYRNPTLGNPITGGGNGPKGPSDDTTPTGPQGNVGPGGTRGGSLNARPSKKANKPKVGWAQRITSVGKSGLTAISDVAGHPLVRDLVHELSLANRDKRNSERIKAILGKYDVHVDQESGQFETGVPILKHRSGKSSSYYSIRDKGEL